MAKLTLIDVTTGYLSQAAINANNAAIEAAMEKTLSRDGTTPNAMGANLDMNTYDILNVGSISFDGDGILDVPQGGTGAATLEDGGVMLGNGTGAVEVTARPTTGEVLVGQGAGSPALESGDTLRASIGVAIGTDVATPASVTAVQDDVDANQIVTDAHINDTTTNPHSVDADDVSLGATDDVTFNTVAITTSATIPTIQANSDNPLDMDFNGTSIITKGGADADGDLTIKVTTANGDLNMSSANDTGSPTVQVSRDGNFKIKNGFEFGYANDTEITRTGAGEIAIEANKIIHAGDLPLSHENGGTEGTDRQTGLDLLTDASGKSLADVLQIDSSGNAVFASNTGPTTAGQANDIVLAPSATGELIRHGKSGNDIEAFGLLAGDTMTITETGDDLVFETVSPKMLTTFRGSDVAKNNDDSYVNAFTGIALPATSAFYLLEFDLGFYTATATPDVKIQITSTSTAPTAYGALHIWCMAQDGVIDPPDNYYPNLTNSPVVVSLAAAKRHAVRGRAVVQASTIAQTINIQWAQNTPTVEDTYILRGSSLRMTEIYSF